VVPILFVAVFYLVTFIYSNYSIVDIRLDCGELNLLKTRVFVLLLIVFSFGWLLNSLITNFTYYDGEKALPVSFMPFLSSPERLSPSDHVKEDQIHVYKDKVVIEVADSQWASFANTNSMDPYIDESSNSIEIKPKGPSDIKEGDIISYHSSITGDLVVHRVVSRGVDENGAFYILKGDNNPTKDPEKVRFDQVHGILVGIIY